MIKYHLLFIISVSAFSCSTKIVEFTTNELPIAIPTKGNTWISSFDSRQDRQLLRSGVKDGTVQMVQPAPISIFQKPVQLILE